MSSTWVASMDLGSPSSWYTYNARDDCIFFQSSAENVMTKFLPETRPASHVPYIGTRATNMVSALISRSGTPPGGCLIKINRSSGHPLKHAFVMSPNLTVRRSHETHERRMFNPSMSQVGESVLTPSGFLQISTADQSTFEQRSNMRTTFASFCSFFVDVDPLKWNRFCVLEPTIVPVRVPILDIQRQNVSTCSIQPCGIPSNLTA